MIGQFMRRTGFSRPVRPGYWFAPKRYGFGAVPATVAGWAATATYLLVIGLTIRTMPTDAAKIILGVCVTIAFVAIVWLKTDGGFAWRWGGEE